MTVESASVCVVEHGNSSARQEEISRFLTEQNVKISTTANYRLHCYDEHLLLEDCKHPDQLTIQVDFSAGKMQWRRNQSERLHRALGINDHRKPNIIDASAGLGHDAFVMAHQGSAITLLENNPIVFLLLQDGIKQAQDAGEAAANNMNAIFTDANDYLSTLSQAPEVIYLDPMFPSNKKSAKTKKEMQVLQTLVGKSDDDQALLELARDTAINRVVAKRPIKAASYAESTPDFSISGKNIRYDVYSKRKFT